MNATASRCIPAVFLIGLLAGCMVPPQNRAAAGGASSDTSLTTADWAKVIEMDRASVRAGQLPKEVVDYDLQIEKMLPEGQQILATHDKARAHIWAKKMNAIVDARNKATEKFSAKAIARNNALANALGNGNNGNSVRPDPCLSPMGKNTCTTPAARQGDSVNYSVGPGGLGATIGHYTVGPGGIGAGGF